MVMVDHYPLNCPIDELMGGGVQAGLITQVYGPPGSGKSNIALQAAANATKMGQKVAFIDPEGSFSRKRLEQIAGDGLQRVLDNTYLFEPASFTEQWEAISRLRDLDVGLIVVDSMVYHYRLERESDKAQEVSRQLGIQMAALLDLARKKKAAVLVTNQVYTSMDSGLVEPVGGDTMKYASKIIIELTHASPRMARIIKHQFMRDGQSTQFKIVGRGVI